jgi:hypothetical protein
VRSVIKIIPALPVAFLVACGSGSSDNPAPEAATTFPIEAAVVSYLTSSQSFMTTYRDPANNDVYTLAYNHVPGANLPFEVDQSARLVLLTIDLRRNGVQLFPPRSQTDFFQNSPSFKYLGTIEDNGDYTVAANHAALPATAKVGDSGNLFTSTTYADNSKAAKRGTTVATWDLQADTANTALFCFNSTAKFTDGSPDISGSECYKVDTSGKVVGNKITMPVNGKTLVFTN